MKGRYYILENGLPKSVDLMTWAQWIETRPDRRLKRFEDETLGIQVITVFLSCTWQEPNEEGQLVNYLYGTLVVGGAMDSHEERHVTCEEAEDAHERLVKRAVAVAKGSVGPPECCKK